MPRAPRFASRLDSLGGSVFERHLPRIRAAATRPAKLHIGDSADPPNHALPLEENFREIHSHWYQYPNTTGVRRLRFALAEYHTNEHELATDADQILVTAGATNALSATVQALVDPGDEVVVLTPSWPFFRGMVTMAGGIVRQVPFYTRDDLAEAVATVEAAISPRTVAIYVNTPNNPSGRVLDATTRRALTDLADRHDLWVISDEAYDGMAYDGRTTTPLALFGSRSERVISTFTFSKIHRFAGLRLGWVRAAEEVVHHLDRALVHSVYSASSLAQEMMLEPVRNRRRWAPAVRADLEVRRDAFVTALGLPVSPCEGTYFVFFDAAPYLGAERNLDDLLVECLDEGVLVAPGGDFGDDYGTWIRACYAAESRPTVEDAARRLRDVLVR